MGWPASYLLGAGAHAFTCVVPCKFLCQIFVLQSKIFSPSVTRLNSAMTQMLDLFVLRPVVHRARTTGCSPGEGRSSTKHTNTVQLQKHLAAALDVKGRGCWKRGEEMNVGVAISSQLTDACY